VTGGRAGDAYDADADGLRGAGLSGVELRG
jgi:hypothetical protein